LRKDENKVIVGPGKMNETEKSNERWGGWGMPKL